MAKITLKSILSGFLSNAALNDNFNEIKAEFQDKVLYRDNPSGEPNQMENNLDMNSNRILNLPAPISDHEPARLVDLNDVIVLDANTFPLPSFSGNAGRLLTVNGTETGIVYTPRTQDAIVETVADLAAITTEGSTPVAYNGMVVRVLGHTVAQDWEPIDYIYISSLDNATYADGAGVIQPDDDSDNTGGWFIIGPVFEGSARYGGYGNQATSDFSTAWDKFSFYLTFGSLDRISIPAGNYNIENTLTLDHLNIATAYQGYYIRGAGKESTFLQTVGGTLTGPAITASTTLILEDLCIRNKQGSSARTAGTDTGITVDAHAAADPDMIVVLNRVRIEDQGLALKLVDCPNVHLIDCEIVDTVANGDDIAITGVDRVTIDNLRVRKNTGANSGDVIDLDSSCSSFKLSNLYVTDGTTAGTGWTGKAVNSAADRQIIERVEISLASASASAQGIAIGANSSNTSIDGYYSTNVGTGIYIAGDSVRVKGVETGTGTTTGISVASGAANVYLDVDPSLITASGTKIVRADNANYVATNKTDRPLIVEGRIFTHTTDTVSTWTNNSISIAHGFNAVPDEVDVQWVCSTAQHGYSQDDVVFWNNSEKGASSSRAATVSADATNIYIDVRNNAASADWQPVSDRSGSGVEDMTEANWKCKVIAKKYHAG